MWRQKIVSMRFCIVIVKLHKFKIPHTFADAFFVFAIAVVAGTSSVVLSCNESAMQLFLQLRHEHIGLRHNYNNTLYLPL